MMNLSYMTESWITLILSIFDKYVIFKDVNLTVTNPLPVIKFLSKFSPHANSIYMDYKTVI